MQEIARKIGELQVTQRKKDGYINATELCKAYHKQTGINKRPGQWFETDRANRLIELVSSVTGIPVTELYQVLRGGNTQQGTWIHPNLATPFASWLSVEYEYMVSLWVQEWMSDGKNPIKASSTACQDPSVALIEPSLNEVEILFQSISKLGIKPSLVESHKLTAIAKSIPRLKIAAEEGKRLISSQMTIEEIPLSPTELGKMIADRQGLHKPYSPQSINQTLVQIGLQTAQESTTSTGKKKKTWHLTEAGEAHGQMQMDTARGHGKTVFCVRWFSSVIPILETALLQPAAAP